MLLEDAGCSMNDVAKLNVYMTDLRDFSGFTEVLPKYFPGAEQPARTVFELEDILGPTGARFEVEAIATIG
jgi:enamine deaminase RidA (YjgF/YER057c/UK114 family)